MFRGLATLVAIAAVFPVLGLYQRVFVATLIRLRPGSRDKILDTWIRFMARFTWHGIVGNVAGARLPETPQIAANPGTLVLMNHQSLLDIPLALLAVTESYPLIVTRRRYARGIPLVSYMLRLYDFPLVEPGRPSPSALKDLAGRAAAANRPFLIFPEGHRSRNGEIQPFRTGGLKTILPTRTWQVYLLVTDGFWKCGQLKDFMRNVGGIQGQASLAGPFAYDGSTDDAGDFMARMERLMGEQLARLRVTDPAGR